MSGLDMKHLGGSQNSGWIDKIKKRDLSVQIEDGLDNRRGGAPRNFGDKDDFTTRRLYDIAADDLIGGPVAAFD